MTSLKASLGFPCRVRPTLPIFLQNNYKTRDSKLDRVLSERLFYFEDVGSFRLRYVPGKTPRGSVNTCDMSPGTYLWIYPSLLSSAQISILAALNTPFHSGNLAQIAKCNEFDPNDDSITWVRMQFEWRSSQGDGRCLPCRSSRLGPKNSPSRLPYSSHPFRSLQMPRLGDQNDLQQNADDRRAGNLLESWHNSLHLVVRKVWSKEIWYYISYCQVLRPDVNPARPRSAQRDQD